MYSLEFLTPSAQKRHIFDQYGEEGLKSQGGPGTFQGDPHKLFSQFFGGSDPFSMFGEGFNRGTFHFNGGGAPFNFGGEEGMDFTSSGGRGMHSGAGPSGFSGASGFSGPTSFGGAPGFGGPKRHRGQRQDPPVEYLLRVTLEELFYGCTKKMKISRQVVNPDGTTTRQDKVVAIDIKPGWKAGTKVTFAKEGDQAIGRTPADVVFVVEEKPHSLFTRDGNDLKYTHSLSLRDALCGGRVEVPDIEGSMVTLPLTEVVDPHSEKRIPAHGMPISKKPGTRGDLVVNFDVKFPRHLSQENKNTISTLLPL